MVGRGSVSTTQTQDLFSKLVRGKHFTKLDLTQAYQQLELDENSKSYLTINMPFAVASTPAIFQRTMDQILQGLEDIVCYLDDILITGTDTNEHLRNLERVFQQLKDYGIRVNKERCAFFQNNVLPGSHDRFRWVTSF